MAASKKAAKLLQQSDGPLRFGKHSLICCSVYQNDLRNARRKSQQELDRRYQYETVTVYQLQGSSAVPQHQEGAPAEAQRSGFGGSPFLVLRNSGMNEFSPLGGNEGYEACADEMHEPGFPVLRVGSRMVVPKEKFIQWAEERSGGAK